MSSTPGTANASAVWMLRMRPLAMADVTAKPYANPGTLCSAAYFAAPVTLACPSTRDVGLPRYLVRVSFISTRSPDTLVDLRLCCAPCRLTQCAHNRASRQLDLEVIVAETARLAQNRLCGSREGVPRRRSVAQLRFSSLIAPWFVSDAAEREARLPDHPVLDLKSCGDGH